MAKYIATRVPEDVYKKIFAKKIKLEQVGKELLGKEVKLPLTHVLRIIVNKQTFLTDDEMIRAIRWKKKR
jgi:hypothetical protein